MMGKEQKQKKMRAGITFFKLRREMAAIFCGVIVLFQTDCRLLCVSC